MPPTNNGQDNQPDSGQLPTPPSPTPPPPTPNVPTESPSTTPAPTPMPGASFGPNGQSFDAPATPVLPEPVQVANVSGSRFGKKKWLLAGIIVLILALGGGYVFAFYLPNTPTHVYSASLNRSAQAVDALTQYIGTQKPKNYKGVKVDGSFKFTSAGASADGTLTAQGDDNNATAKLDVDVVGQKFTVNSRVIKAKGQNEPDIYVQVTGIKSLLDAMGASSLDKLDSQWVSIDHTLLDSVAASMNQDTKSVLTQPTQAQIQDALNKVNAVNKQYIFSTDPAHAVLKDPKYIGKSQRSGRTVYGYQTGYDKEHLKAYISAVQKAVATSTLNEWIKTTTGKSADALDLSELQKSIDRADSNYTFTMYVDAKTKLISTLHFKDTKTNDYFEIGQGYVGGSEYPFTVKFVSTSDPKNSATFNMTTSLNTVTNTVKISAGLDAKTDNSPITLNANLTAAPSNDTVNVTAPTGAMPVTNVLQMLGLGGLASGGSSPTTAKDTGLPFTLTQ